MKKENKYYFNISVDLNDNRSHLECLESFTHSLSSGLDKNNNPTTILMN